MEMRQTAVGLYRRPYAVQVLRAIDDVIPNVRIKAVREQLLH